MSVGSLVRVFTSIVDTESPPKLVTKAVLPSGVTATPFGCAPTVMSVGFFALVFTSMVETVLLMSSVTKTVLPSGVTATAAELALVPAVAPIRKNDARASFRQANGTAPRSGPAPLPSGMPALNRDEALELLEQLNSALLALRELRTQGEMRRPSRTVRRVHVPWTASDRPSPPAAFCRLRP